MEFFGGFDVQVICIIVIKEGDYYCINGLKIFIMNGVNSDYIVVVVKMDFDVKVKGISMMIID